MSPPTTPAQSCQSCPSKLTVRPDSAGPESNISTRSCALEPRVHWSRKNCWVNAGGTPSTASHVVPSRDPETPPGPSHNASSPTVVTDPTVGDEKPTCPLRQAPELV